MSDLRQQGVEIELGGQKRNLLFTLNAIDDIQERCNMPLIDAVRKVGEVIDNNAQDHDAITVFRAVVTSLLNGSDGEPVTDSEVGRMIHVGNYKLVAWKVLEAYGISIPDPDEDDEDDEEENEDPNPGTGQ